MEYLEENMCDIARRLLRGLSRDDLLYLFDSLDSDEDTAVLIGQLRKVVYEKMGCKEEM